MWGMLRVEKAVKDSLACGSGGWTHDPPPKPPPLARAGLPHRLRRVWDAEPELDAGDYGKRTRAEPVFDARRR